MTGHVLILPVSMTYPCDVDLDHLAEENMTHRGEVTTERLLGPSWHSLPRGVPVQGFPSLPLCLLGSGLRP